MLYPVLLYYRGEMFQLYQSMNGSKGSLSEVWIDRDKGLVKKLYKPNSKTITGNTPIHTDINEIQHLYENEVAWANKLKSRYVVSMLDHGSLDTGNGWFILQSWHGPDLCYNFRPDTRLYHIIPDADKQIEEMFEFWQANDVYKFNNAMANMTLHDGKIKAFNFKYAKLRTQDAKPFEHASIEKWISKIEPSLVHRLARFL